MGTQSCSAYFDSLSFEYFESAMIIIAFMLIIIDIPVIEAIIDSLDVLILLNFLHIVRLIAAVEVVSKGRIIIVLDCFEFSIRIEAEDSTEGIISKAEHCISVAELLHARIDREVDLVLNGSQEIDHEVDGEKDANEDEDHYHLIA